MNTLGGSFVGPVPNGTQPPSRLASSSNDGFGATFAGVLAAAGVHRVILVTSAVHAWRAAQEFSGAGLEVVPAPEGGSTWHAGLERFLPNSAALTESRDALHELLGEPARRVLAALHLRRQSP